MFQTALIALDYSAAQGPLLDCLRNLRDMGVCEIARRPVLMTPLKDAGL